MKNYVNNLGYKNTKWYPDDSLGKGHVEIDGISFTLQRYYPFKDYVEKKFGDYDAFLKLKYEDKHKIFLRYKYGFTNPQANEELDATDQYLCSLYLNRDINSIENDGWKFHIRQKLKYQAYCNRVKKEIGL